VTTRLIIENVGVKDKKGVPIGGLTAKDFTITEDGVAQKISICGTPGAAGGCHSMGPAPAGAEQIKIYNKLATSQIAGESAGQIKYKDTFDGAVLRYDGDARPRGPDARAGSRAEVHPDADDRGRPGRYHALPGKLVDVLQDFSDDRNRLLSILETMVVGKASKGRRRRMMPAAPIRAQPSDRMTASSISLRRTGN